MIVALPVILGGGAALIIGWYSVQSLLQGWLLSKWRRPSLSNLEGRRVALYGDVRILDPLHVGSVGDCLWHRKTVTAVGGNQGRRTVSDVAQMAGMSLVIDGREFRVPEFPTEVQGGMSAKSSSFWSVTGEGGSLVTRERWLPVVERLTIVGRVRRIGVQWQIVKDPLAGLLWTSHHPARTALKEYAKGGVGLVVALAIIAAVVWIVRLLR